MAENRPCIILDISRTGARIALEHPLPQGEAGFLQLFGLDLFAFATREEQGRNGLEFEQSVTDEQMLSIGALAEQMQNAERQSLREEVRLWVNGKGQ